MAVNGTDKTVEAVLQFIEIGIQDAVKLGKMTCEAIIDEELTALQVERIEKRLRDNGYSVKSDPCDVWPKRRFIVDWYEQYDL